ncbi:MAG: class I SAM-dependent methyltransferase [Cyclobacteriaceae bacterium]|nr:class I SAM-dependent methyltransferase [Cyclobacteriaceae bacterium]
MVRFISFLLLLSCQPISAQDSWKNVYSESAWAERDRWQKADELIRYLAIQRGSQVADVGCHEGYMTVKLASEVGPQGKVYAVDVEQSKLDRLETILAKRSLHQVDAIKGDYDNPKLPLNSLDGVIILDAYHEMDSHDEILQHVKVALKPGGRLILCEAVAESRRNSTREE